jgi:plastocyanin
MIAKNAAARHVLLALTAVVLMLSGVQDLAAGAKLQKAVTHTITIDGSRFEPSLLAVNAGDQIVWVNKDPFPHTATARAGAFDSKAIAAGASWTYTVSTRGEFAYSCTYHPTMRGKLRVS